MVCLARFFNGMSKRDRGLKPPDMSRIESTMGSWNAEVWVVVDCMTVICSLYVENETADRSHMSASERGSTKEVYACSYNIPKVNSTPQKHLEIAANERCRNLGSVPITSDTLDQALCSSPKSERPAPMTALYANVSRKR